VLRTSAPLVGALDRMKITLDHNCLIHLEQGGVVPDNIRATIANDQHQCFVVNVGASEMQRFGLSTP